MTALANNGWNFLFLWNFSVEIMFKKYQEEVMGWQGVCTVLYLFIILFVEANCVTLRKEVVLSLTRNGCWAQDQKIYKKY